MNYLDLFLIFILLIGGLNGLRQGLIRALVNLVGWFLAFVFAIKFYATTSVLFQWVSDIAWIQQVSAFIAIVLAGVVITWFAGHLLQHVIKQIKLARINRLIGGVFGSSKSVVVILVVIHTLAPWLSQSQTWQQSKLIHVLSPYTPVATKWSQKVTQQMIQYVNDDDLSRPSSKTKKSDSDTQNTSQQTVKNPFSP